MAITTSHQKCILKIWKSVEVIIGTLKARTFYFVHIFEFYLVTQSLKMQEFVIRIPLIYSIPFKKRHESRDSSFTTIAEYLEKSPQILSPVQKAAFTNR